MYRGSAEGGGSSVSSDVETGKEMWREETRRSISLMAADKKLLILEAEGTLRIAEATPLAYKEFSRCELPGVVLGVKGFKIYWTPPALCNSKIYCRTQLGNLVCIDVST
jgi:hypothetical protein